MKEELDYDTSFYTTVNVNLRLHPKLTPKEKVVAIEIGAIQSVPITEQPHTDECLSALTNIPLDEIPTILHSLESQNILEILNYPEGRFLFLKDGIRC